MNKRIASSTLPSGCSTTALALLIAAVIASTPLSSARSEDTAASGSEIKIELNKLEPSNDACRAYLLLENRSPSSFESLKLDLVLFDAEGVVAKRLAVEAAPLPKDKTSLKVFDITKLPCDKIGRVLLNKLTSCSDGQGARSDCLEMVSTTSRGKVPFIK